jgi:hypothetical protein
MRCGSCGTRSRSTRPRVPRNTRCPKSLWLRRAWSTTSSPRSCPGTCARTSARSSAAPSTARDLLRPRPNANDRAWRSRAREPFSTPPVLDRSFGSVAEQRTTNASGVRVACDEHSLAVGPHGPTVLQDAYVMQKMRHFNRERVPERDACTGRAGRRRARTHVSNIVGHVSQDVSDDVQGRMIGCWTSVDANLGARVAAGLGCDAGQRAA